MARGLRGPNGITLGSIRSNTMALARALIVRRARTPKQCFGAADDELVVPLRLGDLTSDIKSATDKIDAYMRSQCGHGITKAVVTGVLHYGYTQGSSSTPARINSSSSSSSEVQWVGDATPTFARFARTKADDMSSWKKVKKIAGYLRSKHRLKVRFRSEPNADLDMCFAVFSRHILDGILIAGSMPRWQDAETKEIKQLDTGRVPGQTQLRKDVIAMLTSQEMTSVLDATNVSRNLQQMIQLPCSPTPTSPDYASKTIKWASITIQFGLLTSQQFADLCASVSVLHGPSETTRCINPAAPDRCEALVKNGASSTVTQHHLVCMTLSEYDAVASASGRNAALFVTLDKRHRGMESLGFGTSYTIAVHGDAAAAHGGGGDDDDDGVGAHINTNSTPRATLRAAARALERKWRAQRGPGWPEDKRITFLATTEALSLHARAVTNAAADATTDAMNGENNSMIVKYGNALGLPKPDQIKVGTYSKLMRILRACCGSHVGSAYRKELWARQSLKVPSGSNLDHAIREDHHHNNTTNSNNEDNDNNNNTDTNTNDGRARHACDNHDLNSVEQLLLSTEVFQLYGSSTDAIGKLSGFDETLDGTYCARSREAAIEHRLSFQDVRYRNLDLAGISDINQLETAVTKKATRLEAERRKAAEIKYNSTSLYFQYGGSATGTTLQFITLCAASCLVHGPATRCMTVRGKVESEESYTCLNWNDSFPPLVCKSSMMGKVPRHPTEMETARANADFEALKRKGSHAEQTRTFYTGNINFSLHANLHLFSTASDPASKGKDGWQKIARAQERDSDVDADYGHTISFAAVSQLIGGADDPFLLKGYANALNLTSTLVADIAAFLAPWNKLKGCCNRYQQPSNTGAEENTVTKKKTSKCSTYNIAEVARELSASKVIKTCGANLKLANPCH